MARPREFDDPTVVRAARDLFWQRGYTATSLAQLQTATGLSRSSLYETYGSKRGLFARAVRSYLTEVIDPMLADVEAPGAGPADVGRYFRRLAAALRSAPPATAMRGCLLLNTATELNDLDAEAAGWVRDYRRRVRGALLHALGPGREAAADTLTTLQIGLMLTARLDPVEAARLAEAEADRVSGAEADRVSGAEADRVSEQV